MLHEELKGLFERRKSKEKAENERNKLTLEALHNIVHLTDAGWTAIIRGLSGGKELNNKTLGQRMKIYPEPREASTMIREFMIQQSASAIRGVIKSRKKEKVAME